MRGEPLARVEELSAADVVSLANEPLLELRVQRGGELILRELLRSGLFVLGSDARAELRLPEDAGGPEVAFLLCNEGRAAIQPCGATPVLVNGRKVARARLAASDEVRFGPYALKVRPFSEKQPRLDRSVPRELAALLCERDPEADKHTHVGPAPKPARAVERPLLPLVAPSPTRPEHPSKRLRRVTPVPSPRPRTNPELREPDATAHVQSGEHPTQLARMAKKLLPRPSRPVPDNGLRLFTVLHWGDVRRDARSFGPSKKPVIASATDSAQLPLWGFSLPGGDFELVESLQRGFRIFVPPGALAERRGPGGWRPLEGRDLRMEDGRRFVTLEAGAHLRLREGRMTLDVDVGQSPAPIPSAGLKALPRLPLGLVGAFLTLLLIFIVLAPTKDELAAHEPTAPPAVAVRLVIPEKPKPEKKKEEKKKEKEEKAAAETEEVVVKRDRPSHRDVAPPPPASAKAMKALAKLAAAGPAMGDLMAKMDKLGSGPGMKNMPSISGMLGNAPALNAGIGNFGLGGGGRGGSGVLGAELLHGRGGGGIGAFGARGYGSGGRVGGTVARATPRTVAVQGSIDREAVAKAVNSHLQEVRACYERALLKSPGLAGKVVLEWQISTAGRVVTAKTKSSSLRDGAVEGCILQSLKTWQFPLARGGVVIVSYPFLFNAVGY